MKVFDVIIIGAGASGLMFASECKQEYLILETNEKIGKKIRVSGGGKCNITNKILSEKNYIGNQDFIKKILNNFTQKDSLKFFHEINPKITKKTQYFCNTSMDVIRFFEKRVPKSRVKLNCLVKDIEYRDGVFLIETNQKIYRAKKVIVASGGLSYKELGATDIAYKIAKKFGHTVNTLKPALVGFTLQKDDFWMKKLSGISVKVKVTVENKTFFDDLLFTHRGISGPAILNASLYWQKGKIKIDFLPNQIIHFKNHRKQISSNLQLPKRFIKEYLKYNNVKDKIVSDLTDTEKEIINSLKNYILAPAGDFGYKKAEVTRGGIDIDEINHNMESKFQKGLYFIGECVDVAGELGGYNFQWAFASAKSVKW